MPVDYKKLRCNNYVQSKTGDIVLVEDIDHKGINRTVRVGGWYNESPYLDYEYLHEDIEPIPLDAEILSKAGFIVDRTGAYIVINEFGNIYRLNCINGEYQSTYNAIPIKWLHQLQNHFSANTLIELTINL